MPSSDLLRHGPDAELIAGADDPEGDFSPVCYQDLLEHGRSPTKELKKEFDTKVKNVRLSREKGKGDVVKSR